MTSAAFRPVAVIPVYNHGDAVGAVAANVRAGGLHPGDAQKIFLLTVHKSFL